jgi:hypothetical protein
MIRTPSMYSNSIYQLSLRLAVLVLTTSASSIHADVHITVFAA